MMTAPANDEAELLRQALAGDQQALATLFARYRDRLRKMVGLRLDRRMSGRIDTSDVLQDAYLDVARRFPEYAAAPTVPFYLWLRALTGQRLLGPPPPHPGAGAGGAGRGRGGRAAPRRPADGVLGVAGAPAACRFDLADAGRRSRRDAASPARGPQQH